MLIEFSVSNYRSFREKQTFSMVAAPRLAKKGNVFKPEVEGEKLPDLLKVAALYGPNASGKSNFISALGIVSELLMPKKRRPAKTLPVAPFRFDPALANEPSRFEIHFISAGMRYEFILAATSERIIEECLIAYPRGKEAVLYRREYNSSVESYSFGETLEGGEILHEAWRKLTSPKHLFISQAVANSNEELKQLKIPFSWLNMNLRAFPSDLGHLANVALSIAKNNKELELDKSIISFLSEVDVPITGIELELEEVEDEDSPMLESYLEELEDDRIRDVVKSFKHIKATLTHRTALGEAQFDFDDESDGTKNLVGFCLPWTMLSTHSPYTSTVAIDELDSSLHPKIVATLIDKLLKFETPAQLIFSTHDTHLMDTKLLRRDQLWIAERDMNGATQLRSIHDFEGRESEDVEKRYYEGRYRGLPVIK